MTHATLLLILDAGRADLVRPDTMPFLHGLAKSGLSGSLECPPGFAQRTILFSGRYPDTSGHFGQFVFAPDRSPFKWIRGLGPLRAAVRPRRAMFPARRAIATVTKLRTGEGRADPAWIPPKLLPYFAPCDDARLGEHALPAQPAAGTRNGAAAPATDDAASGGAPSLGPTLFDLCREAGLSWRDLTLDPLDDDQTHEALARELRAGGPVQLYVARLRVLDRIGHAHGTTDEAALKTHLQTLDRRLAGLHAALAAGHDSWDFLVCGPHGMAPVHRRVDILAALEGCPARPAHDYVLLVNSTLAVFWYLTEKGRREVEAVLARVPGSHLVSEDERRRRRIPVDRQWGDRMLAAEAGVVFWPDHFHAQDSIVHGMHGWLDKREEGHGLLALASSGARTPTRAVGLRPLVDVFPTLCHLLGLAAPPGHEGVSLLESPEVALQQLARA